MYLGDFITGDVVYIERCFVDGNLTPTAVVGGSACCKKMDSVTEAKSGVGAITTSGGQCTLAIFTGSATAYYVKGDYTVYMGKGTVTGTSVIGYTLAQFSIGRTTAITYSSNVLQWNGTNVATPATAGVPDVNVKNWGNTAAAAATLSANVTTIQATPLNQILDGVWDEAIAGHLSAGSTGEALNAAGAAGDPWNTAIPGAYTAGKAGYLVGNLMNPTTLTVSANVVSINAVSTSAVTTVKAVQGLTTADQVTTAVNLTTNNDKTGYALSSAGNNSAADAFLLRDIATGASATDRNVQNALRVLRNKSALTGSTVTFFQEDDATPAWTAVTTTTTAMSITSVDPA